MKTITDNIDEWNEDRAFRYAHPAKQAPDCRVSLPLPFGFKCKGYALAPVVREEDGTMLECKTRAIEEGKSIMDYDFSDCYVHDYMLAFLETPPIGEDFMPDLEAPYTITLGRMIRFTEGELKK